MIDQAERLPEGVKICDDGWTGRAGVVLALEWPIGERTLRMQIFATGALYAQFVELWDLDQTTQIAHGQLFDARMDIGKLLGTSTAFVLEKAVERGWLSHQEAIDATLFAEGTHRAAIEALERDVDDRFDDAAPFFEAVTLNCGTEKFEV